MSRIHFFNTSAETVLALLYTEELKDTACLKSSRMLEGKQNGEVLKVLYGTILLKKIKVTILLPPLFLLLARHLSDALSKHHCSNNQDKLTTNNED